MLHAFGGDEFIRDSFHYGCFPSHGQNLHAVVMVEMDVQHRQDDLVVVVLDVGEGGLDKKLAGVTGERDALNARLTAIQIHQAVVTEATKRGLRASAIPDITARARSAFRLVNGVPQAFEADGQTARTGKDGMTPLSLAEWADLQVSDDPMQAILDLVADYWARTDEGLVVSCLKGIFAAASMSGNERSIASGSIAGQPALAVHGASDYAASAGAQ